MPQPRKNEKRDQEILRLSKEGISQRKIGDHFGVSSTIVSSVIAKHRAKIAFQKEASECMQSIRETNDLDSTYPIYPMLRILLDTRMSNILERHYRQKHVGSISLRELLDMFVSPDALNMNSILKAIPAYRLHGVGLRGVIDSVENMAQVDLGAEFRLVALERLRCLKAYLRRYHGDMKLR